MTFDQDWMHAALEEAALAPEHGDVPVGCIVVAADGTELARAHNRREVDADPTAHAEIIALRLAAQRQGHWRLNQATVYVTLEPCPMCAGAMVNARLGRLVFGAWDSKAGAVESLFNFGQDARLNHRFEVQGGLHHELAVRQLQDFFARLRSAGEK
jgi:tRNA(adenine34) deaminase